MKAGRPRSPQNRRTSGVRGFTLLEVVIALAIASLALVVLYRSAGDGLFAVSVAGNAAEAVERAQSRLSEFCAREVLAPADIEGEDGGGYRYRIVARPVATQPARQSNSGGQAQTLFEIESSISWGTGRHRRSVVLTTRRIGRNGERD
jgi:general secretion pathway protein I